MRTGEQERSGRYGRNHNIPNRNGVNEIENPLIGQLHFQVWCHYKGPSKKKERARDITRENGGKGR